jgi:hypothetical protein
MLLRRHRNVDIQRNSNGICRVDKVERVRVEVEFWQHMNTCVFAVAGMGSGMIDYESWRRSWTLASVVGRGAAMDHGWRDPIEVFCLIDRSGAPFRRRYRHVIRMRSKTVLRIGTSNQQQRICYFDVTETSTFGRIYIRPVSAESI